MQEVFEKIIEKLNSKKAYFQRFYECEGKSEHDADLNKSTQLAFDDAIEIVKQEAEKFGTDTNVGSSGWIPVSERLPKEPEEGLTYIDECDEYIVMIEGADIPTALNYVGDGEWYRDGNYYKVIAWMPLPQPYQPNACQDTNCPYYDRKRTNFDICCESMESMAQIIDIAKIGWTKEQIMEWLKKEECELPE